jgi:hypothetical protein
MRVLAAILILFLTGCATAPKGSLGLNEISIPEPTDKKGVVVFYRLYTPPLAFEMRVTINDKQVASLPNNTFSYVQLPPGEFKLKTHWSAWTGMSTREEKIEVKANQKLFLNLGSVVYTDRGLKLGSGKNINTEEKITIEYLKTCCKYIGANE